MKNIFTKSLVGAAVALAFGGAQAADITISNGGTTANINDGGNFAGWADPAISTPPAAGTPGLDHNGIEFVNIDNPSSWWTMTSSAGTVVSQYGNNPLHSTTYASGPVGTTTYDGALSFKQDVSIDPTGTVSVAIKLTNTTGSTITGVKFGSGIDPDQGGSGKNITTNAILAQGGGASVNASDFLYGTNAGITLTDTTGAGAYKIVAYVGTDCCTAVDPGTALSFAQAVGFTNIADDSISLAYGIGDLAAGQSATIGFQYSFAQAVPEPETYAMLMAGLGLMGLVARRRKQQSGAV